jgi:hypothetical protein
MRIATLALAATLAGCGAPTRARVTVTGGAPASLVLSVFDRFGALTLADSVALGSSAQFVDLLPALAETVRLAAHADGNLVAGASLAVRPATELMVTLDLRPANSDAAHTDRDGDGVVDAIDDCPLTPDSDQADAKGDGVGDACRAAVTPPGVCVGAGCAFADSPPSWVGVAGLPAVSAKLAAALGPDGNLYALGGSADLAGDMKTVQADVYAYDVLADHWTVAPSLAMGRRGLGAAAARDDRLYAVGGFGADGLATGAVEAYDPFARHWASVAPLPTPRGGLAVALGPDGLIYAVGGENGGVLGTVEAFNPQSGAWSARRPLGTARASLALVASGDGHLLAIGGHDGSAALPTVESYDPASDRWSPAAPLVAPLDDVAAARGADGRIYANGSSSGATVQVLDSNSGGWSPLAAMPQQLLFARAAGNTSDGRVCLIGGTNFNPFASVDCYGPHPSWVSGSHVASGATVGVSGDGFAANAPLHVYVDGNSASLASATTDASGHLATLSFVVPTLVTGSHSVFLVDEASHYPARLELQITR